MHRRAEKRASAFAGLPADANQFTVIGLLEQVRPDGHWTDQLIAHLKLLINYTRLQDWAPGARPVVWLTVKQTAREVGISESQVSRRENTLMRLGAIAFRDSGNHRRFGHRDRNGAVDKCYGIDLSPIAELIPS